MVPHTRIISMSAISQAERDFAYAQIRGRTGMYSPVSTTANEWDATEGCEAGWAFHIIGQPDQVFLAYRFGDGPVQVRQMSFGDLCREAGLPDDGLYFVDGDTIHAFLRDGTTDYPGASRAEIEEESVLLFDGSGRFMEQYPWFHNLAAAQEHIATRGAPR